MATVSRLPTADPVISTLMTCGVVAVGPGMALIEALRVMHSAGVRHLPVIDGGRCVGLLAEVDMLDDDRVLGIVTATDLAASLAEHASAASDSMAEQQPPAAEDPPENGT